MEVPQSVVDAVRSSRADEIDGWKQRGASEITFSVCRVCGQTRWSSSDGTGGEGEVRCQWMTGYGSDCCGLCAAVAQRSPEIYAWVKSIGFMHDLVEHPRSECDP